MNTNELARTGFTAIRNLLAQSDKSGAQTAFDLAEALHNLPEPDNDFALQLTIDRLQAVISKHPTLSPAFKRFLP